MNRSIPDYTIEEIRQRSDIVEVIGSFMPLKRSGNGSYKGLCPFHHEKTPSFTVNSARQSFHCFGCGKGGDVFRFVMEKENVDFPNAAHLLASRCGIIIPEAVYDRSDPGRGKRLADARERLYRLNEEFCRFFERELRKNPDSPAAKYLRSRGIDGETAAKFRIGCAPDEWDAGVKFGKGLGFSESEMVEAGLVKRSENANRYYDFFKGRLTFAIWNETGKVVGFSARVLESDAKVAKYVNTPETPVFKKGSILYALPFARSAIGEHKKVVLCEGQLDTIAYHRAGIAFAVAPQGTGFTVEQARILKRYTDCAELSFDADAAGQKAVLRACEILLPLDFEVRVIRIPGGKDPDELYRAGGAQPLLDMESNAVDWMTFLLGNLSERYDLRSAADKSRAAGEALNFIKLSGNQISRELYLRQAAEFLHVSENSLWAQLHQNLNAEKRKSFREYGERRPDENGNASSVAATTAAGEEKPDKVETLLLKIAVNFDFAPRMLAEELSPEWLGGNSVGRSLELLIADAEDHAAALAKLNDSFADAPDPVLSAILTEECDLTMDEAEKALLDCVSSLRERYRRRAAAALRKQLRETAGEDEKLNILMQIQKLEKQI